MQEKLQKNSFFEEKQVHLFERRKEKGEGYVS
jgi:hypothetical protein